MAYVDPLKRDFSRNLRKEQTDTERAMWRILRSRQLLGYKFRRQRVIGPFVVDFCCLNPKLVVELDGAQHLDRKEYDAMRTQFLKAKGFRVLRFWDNQVLKETAGVIEVILSALTPSLSQPPMTARGPGEGD